MTREEIVPASHLTWVWVSAHYDAHLRGLVRWKGQLCVATCSDPRANTRHVYSVEPLNWFGRIVWLFEKRAFEICVGYHWSYPQRHKNPRPHNRFAKQYFWVQKRLSRLEATT